MATVSPQHANDVCVCDVGQRCSLDFITVLVCRFCVMWWHSSFVVQCVSSHQQLFPCQHREWLCSCIFFMDDVTIMWAAQVPYVTLPFNLTSKIEIPVQQLNFCRHKFIRVSLQIAMFFWFYYIEICCFRYHNALIHRQERCIVLWVSLNILCTQCETISMTTGCRLHEWRLVCPSKINVISQKYVYVQQVRSRDANISFHRSPPNEDILELLITIQAKFPPPMKMCILRKYNISLESNLICFVSWEE